MISPLVIVYSSGTSSLLTGKNFCTIFKVLTYMFNPHHSVIIIQFLLYPYCFIFFTLFLHYPSSLLSRVMYLHFLSFRRYLFHNYVCNSFIFILCFLSFYFVLFCFNVLLTFSIPPSLFSSGSLVIVTDICHSNGFILEFFLFNHFCVMTFHICFL